MMKWFVVILVLFVQPLVIYAKSMTFTLSTDLLEGEQELIVIASPSGFTPEEILYIKGAFFKEGSSNYFGYTKYGDTWIKNSIATKNQRKVIIGEWDGTLVVKSDYSDSGFTDNGSYKFKIGFYTLASDGDISSVRWSETVASIDLEKPLPTPTNVPTITPVPTLSPSKTPTLIPTAVNTQIPIPSRTQSTTLPLKVSVTDKNNEKTVLGEYIQQYATPSSVSFIEASPSVQVQQRADMIIPFGLVGLGTGILSLLSILQINNRIHESA